MTKAATKEALQELHKTLAEQLASKIKSGEATAADLNVARQFLKDNHIDAEPAKGSALDQIRNTLPFASEAADEEEHYHH